MLDGDTCHHSRVHKEGKDGVQLFTLPYVGNSGQSNLRTPVSELGESLGVSVFEFSDLLMWIYYYIEKLAVFRTTSRFMQNFRQCKE